MAQAKNSGRILQWWQKVLNRPPWSRAAKVTMGIGILLLFPLYPVVAVSVDIASKSVESIGELVGQGQLLLAATTSILSYAIVLCTVYYAVRTGELVELTKKTVLKEQQTHRSEAVASFIGNAGDVLAYSASLAGFLAEPSWRRWSPMGRALGSRALLEATAAAARLGQALERVRSREPDLRDKAAAIFEMVINAYGDASRGAKPAKIQEAAHNLHQVAEELRRLADRAGSGAKLGPKGSLAEPVANKKRRVKG